MPDVMPGTAAATCEHEESQTKVKADTLRRAEAAWVLNGVLEPIHSPTLESSHLRTF